MAPPPAILGVHLVDPRRGRVRVGTLSRDMEGTVAFTAAETYLQAADRPMFSLAWFDPASEDVTRARLASRIDKIGLYGALPAWFAGLLPEGSSRDRLLAAMGPGHHDPFDMLVRLGEDLPGAVQLTAETERTASAGPLGLVSVKSGRAAEAATIPFSLARARHLFAAEAEGDGWTVLAPGSTGRCIVKVASESYPGLADADYAGMRLAAAIGVETAPCRLVSRAAVRGIPEALPGQSERVLIVARGDRGADGLRIHGESAAQILGAVGERRYSLATTETILNMVGRFSTDRRADLLAAIRRIVAAVLIGHADDHLGAWSFRFPQPGQISLAPVDDILPTMLFAPVDALALRFAGARRFADVDLRCFERAAHFLGVDPRWVVREVKQAVERALDRWPAILPDLLDGTQAGVLRARLETLALVRAVRGLPL